MSNRRIVVHHQQGVQGELATVAFESHFRVRTGSVGELCNTPIVTAPSYSMTSTVSPKPPDPTMSASASGSARKFTAAELRCHLWSVCVTHARGSRAAAAAGEPAARTISLPANGGLYLNRRRPPSMLVLCLTRPVPNATRGVKPFHCPSPATTPNGACRSTKIKGTLSF